MWQSARNRYGREVRENSPFKISLSFLFLRDVLLKKPLLAEKIKKIPKGEEKKMKKILILVLVGLGVINFYFVIQTISAREERKRLEDKLSLMESQIKKLETGIKDLQTEKEIFEYALFTSNISLRKDYRRAWVLVFFNLSEAFIRVKYEGKELTFKERIKLVDTEGYEFAKKYLRD